MIGKMADPSCLLSYCVRARLQIWWGLDDKKGRGFFSTCIISTLLALTFYENDIELVAVLQGRGTPTSSGWANESHTLLDWANGPTTTASGWASESLTPSA